MNQRHCRQPGHRAGRHRGRFLYRRGAVNDSGRAAACHRHFLSVAAALRNGRSCSGHIGVSRSPAGGLFFSLYHRMHQRCRGQAGRRADRYRGRTIISPERHFSLLGVLRCGQSPGHHGPAGHGAVCGHFLPGSGCRMYQRGGGQIRGRPYPGSIHGGAGSGCIPGFRLCGNRSCCFFGLCRATAGQRVAKIGGTVIFLPC